LDAQGQERLRVSRILTITDRDLSDRSTSELFQEGMQRRVYWGAVLTTETSEPWVTLAVPLEGANAARGGLVYGSLTLKSLWELIRELQLSHGGRAYVVDQSGRLIAADDANLVLQQFSFANRPLVQELTQDPRAPGRPFVDGAYTNEHGVHVLATGMPLPGTRWGVVVEQPQSVLYAPIQHKLWLAIGLSALGVLANVSIAHVLSRRFTRPIIRLREAVTQIGSGHLTHQVTIEANDEIGDLAQQFNQMAAQLCASYDELERKVAEKTQDLSALYALTSPISRAKDWQGVLEDAVVKIMEVMGAAAAAIRLLEAGHERFGFSVYRGFSEASMRELPTGRQEDGGSGERLKTTDPLIVEDILGDARFPSGML
jgi:HAMP domain-containing protein